MKQYIAFGLILLATVAAVFLHARKIKDLREEPDRIAAALQGIDAYLHYDRSLNLRLADGVPGEVFLYTRLALAPRHVELVRARDKGDTFLLIRARQQTDTLSAKATIIWSAADEAYDYQLLSAQ